MKELRLTYKELSLHPNNSKRKQDKYVNETLVESFSQLLVGLPGPATTQVLNEMAKSFESCNPSAQRNPARDAAKLNQLFEQRKVLNIFNDPHFYTALTNEFCEFTALINEAHIPFFLDEAEHGNKRHDAIRVLGVYGDRAKMAVPILETTLSSATGADALDVMFAREEAAKALGQILGRDARPILQKQAERENNALVRSAIKSELERLDLLSY